MKLFLAAVGLMMVFEGIPCFCFPRLMKHFAKRVQEMHTGTLRVLGFLLMLAGLLVIYLAGWWSI